MNSEISILVVDDDEKFRKTVKRSLLLADYQVMEADNGADASLMLDKKRFDLIISDIRMPKMDGIELLNITRKKHSHIPVILMTGFSEIIEITEAYDLGAQGFLNKPFKEDALIHEVETILNKTKESYSKTNDFHLKNRFRFIDIGDFINGSQIKYPIFLKLNDKKFVKIANEGEDLSEDRIEVLRKRGIKELYLEKDHFQDYVQHTLGFAYHVSASPLYTNEQKEDVYITTCNLLIELGISEGMDPIIFEQSLTLVKQTLLLVIEQDALFAHLTKLKNSSERVYSHCMSTALIAMMLAKKAQIVSVHNHMKIIIAAFYHDIGHDYENKELMQKSRFLYNEHEMALYKAHTEKGAKILSDIPEITQDIVDIVAQHHETVDGGGFPKGLTKHAIHPLAKVLRLADEYSNWFIGVPGYVKLSNHKLVIEKIESNHQKYDKNLLEYLKSLFK